MQRLEGMLSPRGKRLGCTLSRAGGGTTDYDKLENKPKIEGVTLEGNKTYEQLNMNKLTNEELEALLN
nr:hypothetical protein [Clostridia bacterium]